MAKHVGSGNAVAIKFHKHKETRDYRCGVRAVGGWRLRQLVDGGCHGWDVCEL